MGKVVFWLGNSLNKGMKLPVLSDPVSLFDSEYKVAWLNTDLGKEIIKYIDNSTHVKDRLLESDLMGDFRPEDLSCGCKTVLLSAFHPEMTNVYLDGSRMGDNCFPMLFEVAKRTGRGIKVRVGRLLRKPWDGDDEVLFMPQNKAVRGYSAVFDYLASNTDLFYKGDLYGTQD